MELSPDISVATFLSEALQMKNANTANRIQTAVLDKAIDLSTASVATLLEMMDPGQTLDVVV
jgi:hypothetical protein